MQRARWSTHEDDENLCLEIELGNDYAITLNIRKDGRQPSSVVLWHGGRERPFAQETAASFKLWTANAARRLLRA